MMINKSVTKLKSIVFAFLVLNTLYSIQNTLKAQITTSSPYSRYGLGDVNGKVFGQGFALGGTCIAMQNDSTPMFFINTGNPASYSNIRLTTAELGANYNSLGLQSSTEKKTIHAAGLSYISLAFPFKKWWGGSVGLLPYSSVGYKITDHQEIANIGDVDFLYKGDGGVDQVYFGNGIKPLYGLPGMFIKSKRYRRLVQEKKNSEIYHILKRKKSLQSLSLGVNASYLFGSINNTRNSIFSSSYNGFNTSTGTSIRVSGVYLDYGAQYAFTIDSLRGRDLKQNVKIILGATFATQSNVTAKIDSLSYNYFLNSVGSEVVKDTIAIAQSVKGKVRFPLSYGFGLTFKKGDRWMVSSDFAIQNWSSFQLFNQPQEGLTNSMRISLGAQYVPNSKASSGYYNRIHYRMGLRYAQTALDLKSTQLTEYAASIGFGFPVGRNYLLQNFSMVNLGAEYGQRGTTGNGLIKENFLRITIGFTINDRWFVKPKFD